FASPIRLGRSFCSPSTRSSTGTPASRTVCSSWSTWARLGRGASDNPSPSLRRMPRSRLISASASLPVRSIASSALACRRPLFSKGKALGAGLHDHHAHAVPDDIVHFARDPHPLLGGRHARVRVSLSLQHMRPLHKRLRVELPLPHEPAGEPGPAEHHGG